MKNKYLWFLPLVVLGFFGFTKVFTPPLTGPIVEETRSLSSFDSDFAEPKTSFQKYPTVKMSLTEKYDMKKNIVYLTEEQRQAYRIVIHNGLVYDPSGNVIPDSKSDHDNHINYVMDSAGNFYLFNEYEHREIRHSSILAGAPVSGAGEIVIRDGKITLIDSDSGHYRKASKIFSNVLLELQSNGVDTRELEKN